MRNKLFYAAGTCTAAAFAFGMGLTMTSEPNAPTTGFPAPTTTVTATAEPPETVSAPASTARHAKPRTTPTSEPEAATSKPTTPRHAKPRTEAGDNGPIRDAQDDGKILDDLGKTILPNTPGIPDSMLPFPGPDPTPEATIDEPLLATSEPEYPYEEAWGDTPDTAADPGVVCNAELAADLGVPLADSCYTGHSPIDMWARVN